MIRRQRFSEEESECEAIVMMHLCQLASTSQMLVTAQDQCSQQCHSEVNFTGQQTIDVHHAINYTWGTVAFQMCV